MIGARVDRQRGAGSNANAEGALTSVAHFSIAQSLISGWS
jgi:hypothetical protein